MVRVAQYHTIPLPKGWPRHTLSGSNLAFSAPFTFAGLRQAIMPFQFPCFSWNQTGPPNVYH
jgi:hypothetical protein